jgi:hypothetical protein
MEIVDLWFRCYEKYYGRKPAWGAVYGRQLKNVIARSDVAEMKTLVPAFFAWARPEVIRGGHSLSTGYASLALKLDELRADLAHPERRAFAADAEHTENQHDIRAANDATMTRVVNQIQGEQNGQLGIASRTGQESISAANGNHALVRGAREKDERGGHGALDAPPVADLWSSHLPRA